MSDSEAVKSKPLARDLLEDRVFMDACDVGKVTPTIRQARKYLAKKGAAYKATHPKEA